MEKLFLIIAVFIFISCSSVEFRGSTAVVDLPAVTDYSVKVLREKKGKNPEKEEVYRLINASIKKVADEKSISVVLNKAETVLYVEESLDITYEVIQEINRRIVLSNNSNALN